MSKLNSLLTVSAVALALSYSGAASAQGVGNVEASEALIKAAKAEGAKMRLE